MVSLSGSCSKEQGQVRGGGVLGLGLDLTIKQQQTMQETGAVGESQSQIPTVEGSVKQKTEHTIPKTELQNTGGGALQAASERANMG